MTISQRFPLTENSIWKKQFVNDTDTFPVDVWKPAAGKKVKVYDLFIFVNNKTTGRVIMSVKVKNGGSLKAVQYLGCDANEKASWSHSFVVPLVTDAANDPTPDAVITVDLLNTTSSSYNANVAVQGEEF